jgi:WW domain-containing oxidoreductase
LAFEFFKLLRNKLRNKNKNLGITYYASFFVFHYHSFFLLLHPQKVIMLEVNQNTSAEDLVQICGTDLTGKVAVVTGANSGIGLETARVLSLAGAKVILPCRTMAKANDTINTIKQTVPNADLVPMQLDLSDLASVKLFVDNFQSLSLPLHILINNAGVMALPLSFTKDGFEMQFGVNHLGHFYLTALFTDLLKASAPARVVIVSSSGNRYFVPYKGIDFTNLNAEKGYSPAAAYGQSKLANILHAKELQRRFDAAHADVTVTSVHPGAVESNLGRSIDLSATWNIVCSVRDWFLFLKEMWSYKKVQVGASTNIYCAVSPDVIKGEFYADNTVNTSMAHEQINNAEMAKQLWEVSEKLLLDKGFMI